MEFIKSAPWRANSGTPRKSFARKIYCQDIKYIVGAIICQIIYLPGKNGNRARRCNGDLVVNERSVRRRSCSSWRGNVTEREGKDEILAAFQSAYHVYSRRLLLSRKGSPRYAWQRCNRHIMHLLRFRRDQVSRWFSLSRMSFLKVHFAERSPSLSLADR